MPYHYNKGGSHKFCGVCRACVAISINNKQNTEHNPMQELKQQAEWEKKLEKISGRPIMNGMPYITLINAKVICKEAISLAVEQEKDRIIKEIEYKSHFSKLAGSKYDGYVYYKDIIDLINNK